MKKKLMTAALSIALTVMLCACGAGNMPSANDNSQDKAPAEASVEASVETTESVSETVAESTVSEESSPEAETATDAPVEKNGQVIVLCTSDVHCGVDQGFGYAGLYHIRQSLEEQGYTTILVDDGDSIQGEAMGTLTEGEAIIRLMNEVGYDVVIPGNHEFDYGMDQFLNLVDQANFKYISCNITKKDELLFDPYTIVETAGIKIGFVGVTTPESIGSSSPINFQDETGEMIYGFSQDQDGTALYEAVQKAVDDARAAGADYVYVLAHLGLEKAAEPWTYYDVISHTNGIDVLLDGHSHDSYQDVMKNKDGQNVVRCAVGTKMHCIGYSYISSSGIGETNIWSWPNDADAPTLFGINNKVRESVEKENEALQDKLDKKVCDLSVDLIDKDPVLTDLSGNKLRLVRFTETNLGDFSSDAIRAATGADIAISNGGSIKAGIAKGEVTYGDIITVFPYNNTLCVIKASGQQILDALEWGSRCLSGDTGAFLHPSGFTYEIDATIPSPCNADENGMMGEISGQRRVSNVLIDGKPIDPDASYTLASIDFLLLENGDGFTCFDDCEVVNIDAGIDNVAIVNYMNDMEKSGEIAQYAEIYGQDRIIIKD